MDVCSNCNTPSVNPPNPGSWPPFGPVIPPIYVCPDGTDPAANFTAGPGPTWAQNGIARGSYGANWGAGTWVQGSAYSFTGPIGGMFDLAPLPALSRGKSLLGSNLGVRVSDVTDGSSNTMLVGEILGVNSLSDGRGAWTWAMMGSSAFCAHDLPNSAGTDLIPFYDNSAYPANSPLQVVLPKPGQTNHWFAAARSNHPGLVLVGMADGSVRPVSDNVDLTVWQAMATRAGGEVVTLP